ncbi:MAG: GTP-binding protein [Candidatus Lokiarchaeota archaeon]|nr:GTP-binding protein [Candidatus Lokiarchaeota archaeon]
MVRKRKMSSFKLKVLLCGDGAVGKTSLIHRFIQQRFQANYKLTVGVDILTKDVILNRQGEEKRASLSIWDIGGQQRFEFIRSTFYKGAAGALLIFDLTRYGTFNPGIKKWLAEIKQFAGDIPFVIIGNKVDLEEVREVERSEAELLAENNDSIYIETSAKTGKHVDESFIKLTEKILDKRDIKYGIPIEKRVSTSKSRKIETSDYGKEGFKLTDEFKELINKKMEMILTSKPVEKEGFRFLIMGSEEAQKPFISQLLRIEEITWPPADLNILYNTTRYKLKIGRKENNFQVYLLSNLKKLNEQKNLFLKAVENSNGIVIFFDDTDSSQKSFKLTADTCILLREMFPDLEILITAGHETTSIPYQELEELEDEYEVYFHDDIETLLPSLLINTLKRKKKINRKKKFIMAELKNMQEKIQSQNVDTNLIMSQMKDLIKSIEDQSPSETMVKKQKRQPPQEKPSIDTEKESEIGENLVFVSYSTRDSEIFKISKISELLEQEPEIDKVLYWEKDCGMNIVEYMDKYLGKCKVFLLFCTENSIHSKSVKAEWMAAFQLMQLEKLNIIPIFQDPECIPPLLLPFLRVYYDPNDLDGFISNIKKEILKKL